MTATIKEAKIFTEHIERHLKTMELLDGISRELQCKICGKGLTEILRDHYKKLDQNNKKTNKNT